MALALHPTTREPVIALFEFMVSSGVEIPNGFSSVSLYRGGAWQAVGSAAVLPHLAYK